MTKKARCMTPAMIASASPVRLGMTRRVRQLRTFPQTKVPFGT